MKEFIINPSISDNLDMLITDTKGKIVDKLTSMYNTSFIIPIVEEDEYYDFSKAYLILNEQVDFISSNITNVVDKTFVNLTNKPFVMDTNVYRINLFNFMNCSSCRALCDIILNFSCNKQLVKPFKLYVDITKEFNKLPVGINLVYKIKNVQEQSIKSIDIKENDNEINDNSMTLVEYQALGEKLFNKALTIQTNNKIATKSNNDIQMKILSKPIVKWLGMFNKSRFIDVVVHVLEGIIKVGSKLLIGNVVSIKDGNNSIKRILTNNTALVRIKLKDPESNINIDDIIN